MQIKPLIIGIEIMGHLLIQKRFSMKLKKYKKKY